MTTATMPLTVGDVDPGAFFEWRDKMFEAVCVMMGHSLLRRKLLGDLPDSFWLAQVELVELFGGHFPDTLPVDKLRGWWKSLGAPGDFGYGTPVGDALRNLYDTFNSCPLYPDHGAQS